MQTHEPRTLRQWLCPCTRALEQERRVALSSWLPQVSLDSMHRAKTVLRSCG